MYSVCPLHCITASLTTFRLYDRVCVPAQQQSHNCMSKLRASECASALYIRFRNALAETWVYVCKLNCWRRIACTMSRHMRKRYYCVLFRTDTVSLVKSAKVHAANARNYGWGKWYITCFITVIRLTIKCEWCQASACMQCVTEDDWKVPRSELSSKTRKNETRANILNKLVLNYLQIHVSAEIEYIYKISHWVSSFGVTLIP